jgi:hypothetical protein
LVGCSTVTILKVNPKLPIVNGGKKEVSIFLERFEDVRDLSLFKFEYPEMQVGDSGGPLVMELSPTAEVRSLVKAILKDHGFNVVSNSTEKTPELPVLGAKIRTISVTSGSKDGFTTENEGHVSIDLILSKNGTEIESKSFDSDKIKHTGPIFGVSAYGAILDLALEDILEKISIYLESDDFSKAIKSKKTQSGSGGNSRVVADETPKNINSGSQDSTSLGSEDITEKLEKLRKMNQAGDLTNEEYSKAKAKLLAQ